MSSRRGPIRSFGPGRSCRIATGRPACPPRRARGARSPRARRASHASSSAARRPSRRAPSRAASRARARPARWWRRSWCGASSVELSVLRSPWRCHLYDRSMPVPSRPLPRVGAGARVKHFGGGSEAGVVVAVTTTVTASASAWRGRRAHEFVLSPKNARFVSPRTRMDPVWNCSSEPADRRVHAVGRRSAYGTRTSGNHSAQCSRSASLDPRALCRRGRAQAREQLVLALDGDAGDAPAHAPGARTAAPAPAARRPREWRRRWPSRRQRLRVLARAPRASASRAASACRPRRPVVAGWRAQLLVARARAAAPTHRFDLPAGSLRRARLRTSRRRSAAASARRR